MLLTKIVNVFCVCAYYITLPCKESKNGKTSRYVFVFLNNLEILKDSGSYDVTYKTNQLVIFNLERLYLFGFHVF